MRDKITVKEQKFIAEYIENGGNGTQAALKAYDTTSEGAAAVIANKTLEKPSVAEVLKAELARQGITPEAIVAPVAKGLHAVNTDGSEDLRTQLAAHDRAVKLMGLTDKKDKGSEINFNINRANFGGEFVHEND